jgi:hypothetical protein
MLLIFLQEQDQILSFTTSGMKQKREKLVRIILFRADGRFVYWTRTHLYYVKNFSLYILVANAFIFIVCRAVFADQRFIELGVRDQLEADAWSSAMKMADIALDEPVPEKVGCSLCCVRVQ